MMRCARGCAIWRVSVSHRTASPRSSVAPRKRLRKRFRDDLDRGIAEATATVSGFLFAAAKGGSIPAIIFWLKTRAHWREKTAPDTPVSGDGEANDPVVLIL